MRGPGPKVARVWCCEPEDKLDPGAEKDHRVSHLPKLRDYLVAQKPPPVDMYEMLALLAPRPFYNQSADEQVPAMEAMLAEVAQRVTDVYRLLGAEERVRFDFRYGPHDFPEPQKRAMCDWMAAELTAAKITPWAVAAAPPVPDAT